MGQKPLYKASLDQGLVLKFFEVFFKNRREILILKKMLNFLSFLVLLYISGHFKQKKIKFFCVFKSVFRNRGEILVLKKNC